MNIDKNKVVSLSYELRTEGFEAELVEKTQEDQPLEFIFGIGMMIPKFEENLAGKEKGFKFKFKIESAEAYGHSNPENIVELPKSTFEVEGKLQEELLVVGSFIPMQDQNGNQLRGKVEEVKEETIMINFNPPMADKDLYFIGEILSVREATTEELEHGHVHGPGHAHQ